MWGYVGRGVCGDDLRLHTAFNPQFDRGENESIPLGLGPALGLGLRGIGPQDAIKELMN